MKTNFNWGIFFFTILLISTVAMALYGIVGAIETQNLLMLLWALPFVLVLAILCSIKTDNADSNIFDKLSSRIEYLEDRTSFNSEAIYTNDCRINDIDERVRKMEREYDCAE